MAAGRDGMAAIFAAGDMALRTRGADMPGVMYPLVACVGWPALGGGWRIGGQDSGCGRA